jgi:glycosyltransferase involved in cell wall biosynthesis
MAPDVSIVMPCYQQTAFLGEAVRSVLEQRGVDAELLVMDPGSTDGSQEVLRRLRARYGRALVICCEPDGGQSDAVNRGMAQARARVLGWINSDDRLLPGALRTVVDVLDARGSGPAWVYGRAGMVDALGARVQRGIARYKSWRGRRFSRLKLLTENFIPQPAAFWNRTLWERAGGLDVHRHLDMDYDLWLRFARHAAPRVLPVELSEFRVHGEAKGSRFAREQLAAAYRTAREHAPELGRRGAVALVVHRLLAARTALVYRWLKPAPAPRSTLPALGCIGAAAGELRRRSG